MSTGMLGGGVAKAVEFQRSHEWQMVPGGDPARTQRVMASWPEQPAPPGGYPVMILLDGNTTFPLAVAAARQQERRPERTGVSPAIIVGLNGTAQGPHDVDARTRDYTLAGPSAPAGSGEAEAFLDFIEHELKPTLEQRFTIDPKRYALFGHSYGGLFVLHAFFTRPGAFRRSIAASPSVWWQGGVVLDEEGQYSAALPPEAARQGLLVTVGGDETRGSPPGRLTPAQLARVGEGTMVTRARALAARLSGLGAGGPLVEFMEFPGENHGSVVPGAVSRAIRFGLPPA